MYPLTRFRRSRFLRRSAGLVCALAVTISTLGIPLPVVRDKDSREPFPCMNCGCGCLNAEMCWRECCCFTTEQKLAWARENGVKPPSFLVALAAKSTPNHTLFSPSNSYSDEQTGDDPELASLKPCCRARVLAARQASCCSQKSGCSKSPEPAGAQPVVPGVLAIQALKCQGNSLSLSLLPPVIPTDKIGTDLPLLPQEPLRLAESILYQPPFYAAVVPPPEIVAS